MARQHWNDEGRQAPTYVYDVGDEYSLYKSTLHIFICVHKRQIASILRQHRLRILA